jgi:3-hydroxyacyl-CoA dehydrogenase/enoyl-CoA hydratase/3-hydroxybutyryl-CoA epimerase
MPLLELVVSESAAPWAVEKARDFARAQGKTVVAVRDRPGFYTTRILTAYTREALYLLEQGVNIEEIDRASEDFGFPIGPLALLDEVGMEVADHVSRDLGERFSQRWGPVTWIPGRMTKADFLGRRKGRGFYTYAAKKRPNREVYAFFPGRKRLPMDGASLQERLSLSMVNEAALCLQEGVIASPRDGDVGAVLGLGFPPFRGGPFHHVDALGADRISARLESLAEQHGSRYAPAHIIKDMARQEKAFFS